MKLWNYDSEYDLARTRKSHIMPLPRLSYTYWFMHFKKYMDSGLL